MSKRTFTDATTDNKTSKKTKLEYTIYNYRESYYGLSSAEYIKKKGFLNINKSHGLGSGIYGLTNSDNESRDSSLYIIEPFILNDPVILDKDEDQSRFIELSVYLIKLCESYINHKKSTYNDLAKGIGKFSEIKKALCPKSRKIGVAITKFIEDYMQAKIGDFLKQPINYLLEDSYDGIYNSCPAGNIFSRGSVKFVDILPRSQCGVMLASQGICPFLEDDKDLVKIQIAGSKKKRKNTKKKKKKKRKMNTKKKKNKLTK
jgi:hypothetical protein